MEELVCKECKGRKFRKISNTEYECKYCGAVVIKDPPTQSAPKVVVIQQPVQPQPIVSPFPPEISYAANFKDGPIIWLGGKLIIYPDKFSFVPHSLNFGCGNLSAREWKITDIAGYMKGMLTYFDIKMKDGTKINLAVNGKKNIINQLEERRKFWLENK